jgi:predicted GH43/DUF377 family glycosyl hydrolase
MNTKCFVIFMGIVLAACSASAESPPSTHPESTTPPEATIPPTEVVETEISPSPSPSPTEPPATPTEIPTDTPQPLQFNFTGYENNPILQKEDSVACNFYCIWDSDVVLVDDEFHMFYTFATEDSTSIGYAVSTDGLTFTKHETNPIFQTDGEGFDAVGVGNALPLVKGDTWMLFYNAAAAGEKVRDDSGGGLSIGLTTAPDPTGPWTTGQQVLMAGGNGEWDSGFIIPTSVIVTDDGYRMYYTAGQVATLYEQMCGMATSPDGITWTKYDDPNTTEAPFAESDPVLQPSPTGWDSHGVNCTVLRSDTGWEMFYDGSRADTQGSLFRKTGYASSPDGVHWSKYLKNPILVEINSPTSAIKIGTTYYLYSHSWDLTALTAATGTIDRP